MIKITFLGTCSGTEPMPDRHHSSVAFEINGNYYFFDAGENCSHKAYTSGIDLSRVRVVFISHMHIDHIGGLANLFFTISKLHKVTKKPHINNNSYDVFAPSLEKLQFVKEISGVFKTPHNADNRYSNGVCMLEHEIADGLVFEDENIRVSALHNTHLKETGENGWHAYSFLIEADGKRIVFSGDVGYPEELDPFMVGGADLLIMETGHHAVRSVVEYAKIMGAKKLLFTHHGREILNGFEAAEKLVASFDIDAKICNDGDIEIV